MPPFLYCKSKFIMILYCKRRGSDKMLELEETIKLLNELNEKLKNLGESL